MAIRFVRTLFQAEPLFVKSSFIVPASLAQQVSLPNVKYIEILRHLRDLPRDHLLSIRDPLLETPAKLAMLNKIERVSKMLSQQRFWGQAGAACRVFIGERGVGKTDALRRAVLAEAVKSKNTIGIYHEYSTNKKETLIRPSQFVHRALQERFPNNQEFPTALPKLLSELYVRKLHVLFCLDEVDQLYRVATPTSQALVLEILGEFAILGNSSNSTCAVFLCGSADVLPLLISGKGAMQVDQLSYPLVNVGIPNLNSSKYSEVRVV